LKDQVECAIDGMIGESGMKETKEGVSYRRARACRRCANATIPPGVEEGECSKVEGVIAAHAVCDLFEVQ